MKKIIKLGTILITAFTLAGFSSETTSASARSTIAVAKSNTSTKKVDQKKAEQRKYVKNEKKVNKKLAEKSYDGKHQTIEVNDNKPTFTTSDLKIKKQGWEKYGDLDSLNRATSAEALLNQRRMPTKKRKSIQNVKPTGWHSKKINGSYLYNRSHLIGYALSGENDNWKNLITGTRQLNSPEMLHLEMDIKTYLEKSKKNYVRYSVIPIFKNDELVARGVHMQAQSIDSNAISFNVYIHNIQEGVTINYANGNSQTKSAMQAAKKAKEEQERKEAAEKQATKEQEQAQQDEQANDLSESTVYVATQSGSKYHFDPNCRGLNNANSVSSMDINQAKAQGYTLCGWED